MRVLVLTQVLVYPADAGPKVKTLQVLRHLAASHDVIYCTFVRSEKEMQDAASLREICSRVSTIALKRSRVRDVRFLVESLATGDSFLLRRDYRKAMAAVVAQLLQEERIDVLHVDQLNMMRFVPPEWSGPSSSMSTMLSGRCLTVCAMASATPSNAGSWVGKRASFASWRGEPANARRWCWL